jgi:hypothetical protein
VKVAAWVGSISGLLAVAVGVLALWYAAKQVKLGRDQRDYAASLALGQFLLQLDEAFQRHQAAHLNLRPGGQWRDTKDRPTGWSNAWKRKESESTCLADGLNTIGWSQK